MREFNVAKIRADFPQLTKKLDGKPLIYLDSAATSLRPWQVIERLSHFNSYEVANVHRAAHTLANRATEEMELVRTKTKSFINAKVSEEIIFTKGTTESINLVASSWGERFCQKDDEILVSEMEHHSNIVPWQQLCLRKGARLKVIQITDKGEIDLKLFQAQLSKNTKMVAITHCSNTLGTVNDVKKIVSLAKSVGACVLVDGAQRVSAKVVDVQDIGCDFYAFSAHKMFGPFGVGVLFGKRELLSEMPPYQGGGSMISKVSFSGTSFNDPPYRFEAGTPHVDGIVAFGKAIDYICDFDGQQIINHEKHLVQIAKDRLAKVGGVRLVGEPEECAQLFSFNIDGCHHSDIGQILDQQGIAVRVGHHCTQPLMERLKLTGTVRVSFSIYSQESEIERLAEALGRAKEMLS